MVSARKIIGMAFSVKRVLPALDRVVLSAISFVLALALRNVFSSLRYGLGVPPDPKGVFQSFWLGVLQMLWFGWPGLLLALPVVLFFTNLRTWRFWALLGVGTAIGPIYLWLWLGSGLHWHFDFGAGALKFSVPISGLSSLIYLLLLRHAQRTTRDIEIT